jgi:hypothetical protein
MRWLLDRFGSAPWSAIADKCDNLYASQSRPTIALACGFAVSGACFVPSTAPIAIPVAGGIVAAYMAARSVDKKTTANAEVAKAQAQAGV